MNTMQFINTIISWLLADPSHLVVAASALAALTPTPSPDTPYGRIYRVLDLLALNFLHAKSTGTAVTIADIESQVVAILAKQKVTVPVPEAVPHVNS